MTINVKLSYTQYASLFEYGRQICDLPNNIQIALEEYMDGMDVTLSSWTHPDELVSRHLKILDKRGVVVHLLTKREVSDEQVESWSDETIEQILDRDYIYLGNQDGLYYVLI